MRRREKEGAAGSGPRMEKPVMNQLCCARDEQEERPVQEPCASERFAFLTLRTAFCSFSVPVPRSRPPKGSESECGPGTQAPKACSHSLIHSFKISLKFVYYMPGPALAFRETVVDLPSSSLRSREAGKMIKQQKQQCYENFFVYLWHRPF